GDCARQTGSLRAARLRRVREIASVRRDARVREHAFVGRERIHALELRSPFIGGGSEERRKRQDNSEQSHGASEGRMLLPLARTPRYSNGRRCSNKSSGSVCMELSLRAERLAAIRVSLAAIRD